MSPRRALVREPGKKFTKCLSCHPLRHTVNLQKAKLQHAAYRRALTELGLEVITLEPDDEHADACFVEDNAVVHGGRALICRMGAESRRDEVGSVERRLKDYVKVRRAREPATLEGGDVVHFTNRLISGLSQRTNEEGIHQMSEWLQIRVDAIEDPKIMHLKSYLTALDENRVLASERFAGHPLLKGLEVITVPVEEAYAADSLSVGGTVILPAGMPRSAALLRSAGFDVLHLDVSEFQKCDGAVTCLSILF